MNAGTSVNWSLADQRYENATVAPTVPLTEVQPPYFTVIKIFFYALILLCSLLGNGVIIFIIACNKRIRTASHLLIMNLAACDVLTPLVGIPFDFAVQQTGHWLYGSFGCKILYPVTTLTSTASALILAVIALERYRQIMHPFKSRLTKRQVVSSLIVVYAFSLLVVSPYISVLQIENDECVEKWSKEVHRKLYTVLLFMVQYFLPLLFMMFMYSLALQKLYTVSGKTYLDKIVDEKLKGSPRLQCRSKTWSIRWLSRCASIDANKRATKMFIVIVIVFAIFMFPNQVIWLWDVFRADAASPSSSELSTAFITCSLFTYTNSVVNPIIFARMSPEFRRFRWNCLT